MTLINFAYFFFFLHISLCELGFSGSLGTGNDLTLKEHLYMHLQITHQKSPHTYSGS